MCLLLIRRQKVFLYRKRSKMNTWNSAENVKMEENFYAVTNALHLITSSALTLPLRRYQMENGCVLGAQ